MKRIFIALPNDTLGGAEQYLKMVCGHFDRLGYQIDVLFLKRMESCGWVDVEANNNHVKLYYTRSRSEKYGLFAFIRNVWRLKNYSYQFVFTSHVHITGLIGFLCRLGVLKKQFFVGRESTLIFDRFVGLKLISFKLNYYLGYPSLDLLVCQTDIMLRQLQENLPELSKKFKTVVIPNPIDWVQLYSSNRPTVFLEGDKQYLVAAGRLIPEKGFDVLISATRMLLNSFPNCQLLIFGEGKERGRLLKQISDLGMEKNAILMGFDNNVISYFQSANLCVVSSIIEGFPNVLLQMMAKNVSVVSTLCAGGIDEIPGIYTAQPGNVYDLSRSLRRCLESHNDSNRLLFDEYLKERSIDIYVKNIENNLSSTA